jgi:hypothetical protein
MSGTLLNVKDVHISSGFAGKAGAPQAMTTNLLGDQTQFSSC